MRFKSVRATAFGCLKDQTLDFAPGFTVLFGMNEAGKSTWHAAMYAALCGVRRGPGVNKEEADFKTKFAPWGGGRWAVSATVELDGGGQVHLHHDLEGKVDCKAVDEMGRDRSPDLMFEGMPDGSTLLGLNRNLYPQVGCIRQADILGLLQKPHELQERLQRTVASPGAKATVAAAMKNVREFKAANVGLNTKNSTKRLAIAERALAESERRLREVREKHDEYLRIVDTAARLRSRASESEAARDQLEAHVLRAEAAALAARVRRMTELAGRNPNGPPADASGQDELALTVAQALKQWEERPQAAQLAGKSANDLARELDELPAAPEGDLVPHDSVTAGEQTWRSAGAVLSGHLAETPVQPATAGEAVDAYELRSFAEALRLPEPPISPELEHEVALARRQVAKASTPGGKRRVLMVAGALVAIAGLGALSQGAILGIVALIGGAAVAAAGALSRSATPLWRAVEEQTRAEASLAAAQAERSRIAGARERATRAALSRGIEPTPDALLCEARAIEESLAQAEALSRWEARREQLTATANVCARQLAEALQARGQAISAGPESSLASYKQACAARSAQMNLASARPALRALLQARQEAEKTALANVQRAEAACAALLRVAAELSLAAETEEEAALALRAWQEDRRRRQAAEEAARREWQELEALRQEGSEEELEQRAAGLAARAVRLNPEAPLPQLPAGADPGALLDQARFATADAEREASTAQGRCAEFARGLPSVSEAEEALELAKTELVEVRTLESILDRTMEFLRTAEIQVQRNIAPVLSQLVEPRLAKLTGGRYARIAFDPADLKVNVIDATGAPRSAANLSHGTAEQVYLLLRVALAEIFGGSGESVPLLLDDVTVESDRIRTEAILSVLHDLSASHQVVLFTQEDQVLDWAKANLNGPNDSLMVLEHGSVLAS